tara:strand:- start:46 stop:243 length:198 start_codon:yes stop_codon:yes gene_type:complete
MFSRRLKVFTSTQTPSSNLLSPLTSVRYTNTQSVLPNTKMNALAGLELDLAHALASSGSASAAHF